MWRLVPVVLLSLLLLAACGAIPPATGSDASGSRTRPTDMSIPSPTTPVGWQTYADGEFGFSIAYPPAFVIQNEGSSPDSVRSYRAYDPQYATSGYPRGQVEFAIYPKDAATLTDWVAKHTGEPTGPTANPVTYWVKTSNLQPTTADGRDAIYFEWNTASGPVTVHVIAFFWKTSYVFRLEWWANDSAYLSTIKATAKQMLNSFQG
jgi:hypothetical protein